MFMIGYADALVARLKSHETAITGQKQLTKLKNTATGV